MGTDSTRTLSLTPAGFGAADKLLRTRLLRQMANLRDSQLRLVDAMGDSVLGTPATDDSTTLRATVWVNDPAFYRFVAANGSVGAGEAFMDGLWQCDDLVTLMRMLVRSRDLLDAM